MQEIYLLSGLGADQRVFDYLDLSDYKVNHINWITPLTHESISQYATRLLEQIHTSHPVLVGVSFGGMMAIEIGKLISVKQIILISSAQTRSDLPFYYRIAGGLGLNKLIPAPLLKNANAFTYWFFGAATEEEKELLKAIIKDTDIVFLKWAIHQIVNWKNEAVLNHVSSIHGTSDWLLPNKGPDFKIRDGGHLMIVNKAIEINGLLKVIIT